ncbi:hypothetical protein KQX54_002174 [Cotesia glomerata]|uniref:Uncharacterized protein n=1 Tax=Cotesia glomerata TaxID=32391 RepID=A0AAV7IW25_COTGL|nr:hypothetical protein KQX54_002174 [Cotesia glomerata]
MISVFTRGNRYEETAKEGFISSPPCWGVDSVQQTPSWWGLQQLRLLIPVTIEPSDGKHVAFWFKAVCLTIIKTKTSLKHLPASRKVWMPSDALTHNIDNPVLQYRGSGITSLSVAQPAPNVKGNEPSHEFCYVVDVFEFLFW